MSDRAEQGMIVLRKKYGRVADLAATFVKTVIRYLVLFVAILNGSVIVHADTFSTVEVRGAEFIPEEDVQLTCGALPSVNYSQAEIRAIEDCLMSTGVFETVDLYAEGETLVIEVVEIDNRPGRVEAALSYVSQDGITAELFFERYNLFPSTYGALQLSYNSEVESFEGNLYRTDVIGENLDLGLDVFGHKVNYDDQRYTDRSIRIEPYLAWTPDNQLRIEAGLGVRDYSMKNVDAGASPLLVQEAINGISAPYLRFGLSYSDSREQDTRNGDWAQPGFSVSLEQFFWNVGTPHGLSDTRVEVQAQVPLAAGLRLQTGFRAGTVMGLSGNDTRAIDRYFLGADTFRGFAPRGIGPRDAGDALGGNHYVVSSLELQRDFDTVWEMPLRAGVFLESGASWGLDDTLGGRIGDDWATRTSMGLSLTFEVANTPVSVYVAQPIQKQRGDETQAFGLGFAARF